MWHALLSVWLAQKTWRTSTCLAGCNSILMITVPCFGLLPKSLFALREILFVFAKKSVNAKPFSVRTIFLTHQNFCKSHQTSKMPSTWFFEAYNFCRARKSIVPWQIPFNWSSYFVIERRVSKLSNDSLDLPILKCQRKKASWKLRFHTRILQVEGGVDVCWATDLKSPWLVKAESFPTEPKVIVD